MIGWNILHLQLVGGEKSWKDKYFIDVYEYAYEVNGMK
jgi:hypothetical protein